jgi:hypothetical protein
VFRTDVVCSHYQPKKTNHVQRAKSVSNTYDATHLKRDNPSESDDNVTRESATTIDNVFLDISKIGNYSISPITNGLSDHDAEFITLHSIGVSRTRKKGVLIRKINACSINDFILKLSHENWDLVFSLDEYFHRMTLIRHLIPS